MFESFEGVPDYPQLEQEILTFWDEFQVFNRLREQTKNGQRWEFQDGPITANNPMGVHHAWGRTYKDIFNRYHAMNGQACAGRTASIARACGSKSKSKRRSASKASPISIAFGIENFSRACRARVEKFAGVITAAIKRLGQWMDWARSYYHLRRFQHRAHLAAFSRSATKKTGWRRITASCRGARAARPPQPARKRRFL